MSLGLFGWGSQNLKKLKTPDTKYKNRLKLFEYISIGILYIVLPSFSQFQNHSSHQYSCHMHFSNTNKRIMLVIIINIAYYLLLF